MMGRRIKEKEYIAHKRCSVEGCDYHVRCKGFCNYHYNRHWKENYEQGKKYVVNEKEKAIITSPIKLQKAKERYATDELFRETRKARSIKYYHDKVKRVDLKS